MPVDQFRHGLISEVSNLRVLAISLCSNVHLADDLVQETLLKALSNSEKFESGTKLRAWLFTILRNRYISVYRKRGREIQDPDGAYSDRLSVWGEQESAVELNDFRKAFDKLSIDHRGVLILVGATGASYEEAAEICGIAVGTVKSRVSRAKIRLAELLGIAQLSEIWPKDTARVFNGP